ncbi:amidohydrolase family protein [Ruegeria atlantica]|uniref:amidohydrolase family protein n=1 Tax=Ruegeria atlantica TaxID=81569 RepID=UPI00249481A4|nr:amidohydrolase family protein [Ruegeria atlantica]
MRLFLAAALAVLSTSAWAQDFDLVILNGRVMDPETKLDAVRNVGIKDGRIEVVTDVEISGAKTIDATGHVVAPGFIDFHWHGQDPFGIKLALRGGVTSPLELEVGAYPIEAFYDSKEGKSQANYGASASHLGARLHVLDEIESEVAGLVLYSDSVNKSAQDGSKWSTVRTAAETPERKGIVAAIEDGMRQGAIGIGFPIGYATQVSSDEVNEVASIAQRYNSFILTHVRYLSQVPPSGFLGIQELMAVAQVNDVPLIVQHVPSNCLALTGDCLALINHARDNGMKISAEFYPWEKGSAIVGADYLGEGFQENTGMDYSDLLIVATNETLTEETYTKYRAESPGETMIMHHIKNADMMKAFADPLSIVGSDAFPFIDKDGMPLAWDAPYDQALGHPRGAGTSGKMLRLTRETGAITLMDAIAKMSYYPALFIEDMVPDMRQRGRIQPGMIADIAIFDPATVTENSDYDVGKNALPTTGIPYVIVDGTVVVSDSKVLEGVFPGQPIRNPVID